MSNRMTTNSFIISAAYAAIPVVLAKDEHEPKLVKPRDLSIYPEQTKDKKVEKENWEPTIALGPIQKVRDEIKNLNQHVFKIKERVYTFVQTGISHSESFLGDLREEKNSALRAGFVAGGSLAGLLVAGRKGKFKKLVYTTTGASAAFYVGYPQESAEATKFIKRYSIVSYHLINNVLKDLTGFELPPLPASKIEAEPKNSGETKPDVKELFYSLIDYGKNQLESVKKIVLNKENGSTDKDK